MANFKVPRWHQPAGRFPWNLTTCSPLPVWAGSNTPWEGGPKDSSHHRSFNDRQLHCTRSERLSLAATQEPSSNSFSSEKWSWNSTQLYSKCFLRISSKIITSVQSVGFPGGASGKEPASQNRRHNRHEFNPWVRKIPWRRTWQPTPVFLPGESHGQRSLVGSGP